MISNQFSIQQKLSFNQQEKELFDFFSKFLEEEKVNVTLRVAGGWVRDKILGLNSEDIDIAIDNMMGEDLVQQIVKYMQKKGEGISGHGVIKTNPDKSKHLETATCKLKGLSIDFVNLRGEEYAQDSRIPQIVFGTPLQDAERRDLTINSMFYNINEDKIEDFTQKGLQDLQNKLIRTPLNPMKTFLDDPLRVLRTIRFAARFDFKIDEEVIQAFQKPEVRNALVDKVSKERVKIELEKMLKGKNPQLALDLIYKNNLWSIVFLVPQQCEALSKDPKLLDLVQNESYKLCITVYQQYNLIKKTNQFSKNYDQQDVQLYSYLTACCQAYSRFKFQKGKNMIDLPFFLMSDSLKFSNKDTKIVSLACEYAQIIKGIIQKQQFDKQFIQIVQWIKNTGDIWELCFIIAQLSDQINNENNGELYDKLLGYINEKNLQTIYLIKPLISGNEIKQIFKLDQQGPLIRTILGNIFIWQVNNHKQTRENLLQYIEQNKDEFLEPNPF